MSNTHAEAMGGKFIKLIHISDDKGNTAPVVIPLSMIKNISRIERYEGSIKLIEANEHGKCGITLLDGGMIVVDHSLEELCFVLSVIDTPEVIKLMNEKQTSTVN
jgi:hypothetical protein